MRRFPTVAVLVTVCFLGLASGAATHLDILGLAEIQTGQKGSLLTVLTQNHAEEIPLEILGVAEGFAGPGRDVIVARLEGPKADWFGVVAGMSGSPVTIDGRLVGALAYRIGGFTREAIAGITPIEQMLRMPREPAAVRVAAPLGVPPADLLRVVAGLADAPLPVPPAIERFATPLAISGLHPLAEQYLLPELASLGLGPIVVAGTGGESEVDRPLAGGDPVAVVLVQGDMTVAATGTVTLVDGDHVLAMGHPVVRAGDVEFPMARASILVTVASQAGSFKMARIGEVIGVFHQDRPQGLAGRLGDHAQLMPLALEITSTQQMEPAVHHFELVRTPMLAGALTQLVVSSTLLASDVAAAGGTIQVSGRVLLSGREPLAFQAAFPGGRNSLPVAIAAGRYVGALTALVQDAAVREGVEVAIELSCRFDPAVQLLRIEELLLQRPSVKAGGIVELTAVLRDERTGRRTRQAVALAVPRLAAGTRLELLVGDAASFARADGIVAAAAGTLPNLNGLAGFLARLQPPDRLYARLSRPAVGLLLETEPLPDLPPSVATVLRADGSTRGHRPLGLAEVAMQVLPQDAVVRGAIRRTITVQ